MVTIDRAPLLSRLGYRTLIATAGLGGPAARAWDRAWHSYIRQARGKTRVKVHGTSVTLNAGYAYPAFARRWRCYNAPLVEAVELSAARAGSAITMVDVGAAIGDTVLLVMERCPGAVARVHCVEGDDEFFGYLEHNLGNRADVVLHHTLVSDTTAPVGSLVRTHPGTASVQGAGAVSATTLDTLLHEPVDLVKVDTDGFDGRVLAGAATLLAEQTPHVLFEWHPKLLVATGNDVARPFRVLEEAGYSEFRWYDKFGHSSHRDENPPSPTTLEARAAECLEERGPAPDWHYDVLAVPPAR